MTEFATDEALAEVLDGCLAALDEEADAVRQSLARRGLTDPIQGLGGRLLESPAGGLRYEWQIPDGPALRVDEALRVSCPAGETRGFVTGFERRRRIVRISVSDWLGARPGSAELTFDPTWLLEALADRLAAISRNPGAFHPDTALRLLGRTFPRTGRREPETPDVRGLNGPQREALARILGSDALFVWGPPGTGKTRLLAHAAAELARSGPVLVVATPNAALDEAAGRIAEVLGPDAVRANRLIRVGAAASPTGDAELSLEAAVERHAAGDTGIGDRLAELEREVVGRSSAGTETLSLRTRYARLAAACREASDPGVAARVGILGRELQRAGGQALRRADVVLSTFARLALREDLAVLRFGSVLIDEASAAPLPHVVLAAVRARERAVAIGDFQQLPPVVVSRGEEAARWLRQDAFREAGVVPAAPPGEIALPSERDALCAMLHLQYRMRPPIRALVSDTFYGGRLADAGEVIDRPPGPEPLILLDTTSRSPAVEREEGSRANPVHVEVVLSLLEVLGRCGARDVGLIAPYRLQARRTARLARARLGRAAPAGLEVTTIHRLQGKEKAVVVFDTVDAPPGRSWFLDERRNPDLPRLLNVAISRARDALVFVASPPGLRQSLPQGALLLDVLDRVASRGAVLDAGDLASRGPGLFGPLGTPGIG
ncbi:MAG: DEAD/DEAH box helicase [Gemmatimonadota bacterium]